MNSTRIDQQAIPALKRLVTVARRDTGQSGTIARFLLAMYNGYDYPFNLNELRGLDDHIFADCLEVLKMNTEGRHEIQDYLTDGKTVFRELVELWAPQTTDSD